MRLRPVFGLIALVALTLSTTACSLFDRGTEPDTGVLRIALVRPTLLDPMRARTIDEQFLADQLYDTLVRLDPASAEPGPGIAASWSTSDDGLTWEFSLDDATFADGAPLTAADVKATFDRAVRKDSGSAVADLLEPVVGWQEVAVAGTTTELAGVTILADDRVGITLSSPWSSLPAALAHPGLGIVRASVADTSIDDARGGSGPFTMPSRTNSRITLRPAEGRTMKSKGVDVRLYDDQAAAYAAFVDGKVDWAPVPIGSVEEAATRYGREHFRTYVAELFYAFNLRNPKWADRRLREAAVRAVDRQAIIDDVYQGTMRPMTSFAVAGIPGAVADTCSELCTVDIERAKALVAEVAASAPLPEVAIDFEDEEAQTEVAEHIARDLEAAGFTVTLRPKPLDEYETFAVSGDQDLFRLGWIAAYPAMDAFVAPLFGSGSANNLPGFALTGVDELLRQARAAHDPAARSALYEQAERAVFSEAAVIPVGHFQQHWVASGRVRDLELTVTGTFDAASVWLADG